MGVTTTDIDPDLLNEARELLGEATTKATIDAALREAVMRRRQADALDQIATVDLDLHPSKIEYSV